MKRELIKSIRKLIYFILSHFRFPSFKESNKYLLRINQDYLEKKLKKNSRKFHINQDIDLSFVIPVYNAENIMDRCIESLVNQKTKYSYEIIFINDGSSDNSLNKLKKIEQKHDNVKVLTQENKGIASARNAGLNKIRGKYVAFVDIDDFIKNDYVEILLDNAYTNNADIVRCNYYEYSINENKIIKSGVEQANQVFTDGLNGKILSFKGYPWGGVFKTTLWEDIEYPEGYWYEDMIIRMILFRKAKVFSYINDKIYYYCIHSNNISKSVEKTADLKCLDQFFLVKELYNLSNQINLKQDIDLYYNIMYEYSVVLWLRTRKIDKKLRKELFNDASKFVCDFNKDSEDKEIKILYKIFKNRDYISWNLYAIYKMLGVKFSLK